jgi:hypothetical protein
MLILCGVTPNPSFPQMRSLYNRKLLGGAIAGSLGRFVSERNTRVSDLRRPGGYHGSRRSARLARGLEEKTLVSSLFLMRIVAILVQDR